MTASPQAGRIWRAWAWMVVLMVLFIWLPLPQLTAFIAGVFGGFQAGSIFRALGAVTLVCLTAGVAVAVLTLVFSGSGPLSALFGTVGFLVALFLVPALLVGALAGAIVASLAPRLRTLRAQ